MRPQCAQPGANGNRRTASELGILWDSQECTVDGHPGTTDGAAEWPLSALEQQIRDGHPLPPMLPKSDYDNVLLIIQVATADVEKSVDPEAAEELLYWGIEIGRLLAH